MTDIFNHKHLKQLRRNLRKQEVEAEKILWGKLRNKQQKYKFRRQFGIGNYIVGFYCPKLRLAIEIDGATHSATQEIKNDLIRENFLNNLGIKVKRFTNTDIYEAIDEVAYDIYNFCSQRERELREQVCKIYLTSPLPSPSQ